MVSGLPRFARNDGNIQNRHCEEQSDAAIQKGEYVKQAAIYILTNQRNGTLYAGVTSDLVKRIYQYKQGSIEGFTQQYNCNQLVYFELYDDMENAILREKQLKAGSRKKKLALIESENPNWNDLYETIL